MTDQVISLFDCTPVPQEPPLVIPAAAPEEQSVLSVSSDVSACADFSGAAAGYRVVFRAVRRFTRWITVTAERVRRTVVRTVCKCFRQMIRNTGVQILRQSAILRV